MEEGVARADASFGLKRLRIDDAMDPVWRFHMSGFEESSPAFNYMVENVDALGVNPDMIASSAHPAGGPITTRFGLE